MSKALEIYFKFVLVTESCWFSICWRWKLRIPKQSLSLHKRGVLTIKIHLHGARANSKANFLWTLSLLNGNIRLDFLCTHLEVISLYPKYKRTFFHTPHIQLFFFSGEAVFSRCLSSLKDDRVEASKQLEGPPATKFTGDKKQFIEDVRICFTRPRPVLRMGLETTVLKWCDVITRT